METKVMDLISSTLKITPEKLKSGFDNSEIWDSLTRVEVVFALEDAFGIQLTEEELTEAATPSVLFTIVMKKVAE